MAGTATLSYTSTSASISTTASPGATWITASSSESGIVEDGKSVTGTKNGSRSKTSCASSSYTAARATSTERSAAVRHITAYCSFDVDRPKRGEIVEL
jgi:hypothetical protein